MAGALLLAWSGEWTGWGAVPPADTGAAVVVIYNSRMPESKAVADYYARRRGVPKEQIFGFDLPTTESMTRAEYLEGVEKPLLKQLEAGGLVVWGATSPAEGAPGKGGGRKCLGASIRYGLLCYGVPTKILRDTKLVEPEEEQMQAELRRNEASVDSQLACLPSSGQHFPWAGPLSNPFYGATNRGLMQPSNGVLMVTRLDGPSAAIARGLVDKAMEAETNGLWGRAYFDSRGITNASYKLGDDWIRGAAEVCRRLGFETILDESPNTFGAGFPMSQIAIYAGWYDGAVSGPFTRPQVEFMPGAFAYHLHSFNAATLRTEKEYWVGPLLAKGATITLGTVEEPYLSGTPDIATFCARLIYSGFSFGEAAYAAQSVISWQGIAVGDPLYRPFGVRPDVLHGQLEKRQSKYLEWSHLRVVNLNLALGYEPEDALNFLEGLPLTRKSAVLLEKLADLYWNKKKLSDALELYGRVIKLDPSPLQKLRVLLNLAQRSTYCGANQQAYDYYQQLLQEFPDYPDRLSLYQKLLPVAQALGRKEEIPRLEEQIKRLRAPGGPAPKS